MLLITQSIPELLLVNELLGLLLQIVEVLISILHTNYCFARFLLLAAAAVFPARHCWGCSDSLRCIGLSLHLYFVKGVSKSFQPVALLMIFFTLFTVYPPLFVNHVGSNVSKLFLSEFVVLGFTGSELLLTTFLRSMQNMFNLIFRKFVKKLHTDFRSAGLSRMFMPFSIRIHC